MAASVVLDVLGIAEGVSRRAVPLWFVVHASTGSVALITGPLQLNRDSPMRFDGLVS
jgi:hypothetical protein